ncbi:uncharacterized protein LOC127869435 isoform X2 [Dreissena polymorpha]|nr:uncharacterized protein LOC127869435 isoform X2 [Dreissena polymorpha]
MDRLVDNETRKHGVDTITCKEAQTDACEPATPPAYLLTLAQEISRAVNVYKDSDRNLLSGLRFLLGYGPFNFKLVDLIDFEPGEVIMIKKTAKKKLKRYQREQRTCDEETHYPGVLSWLIGSVQLDSATKWPISDDGNSKCHQTIQLETLSVELSTVMYLLGYGAEIRRKRIEVYKISDSSMSNDLTCITTGSKSEGLTSFLESDHDRMYVLPHVVCVDDNSHETATPDDTTVIKVNNCLAHAGHCKLHVWNLGTIVPSAIMNALCDDGNGGHLLDSDLFISKFPTGERQPEEVCHERAGPSLPHSFLGSLHSDRVFTLKYNCPSILQRWAERPRLWPPLEVVSKVVSFGAFVAPVGFKESSHRHLEWRICFNTGETELMNNLSDTQLNIYVLLKMVVKCVLKPSRKEVTSYVLKNIVLWQAELNSPTLFHEKSLLHWFHDGLAKLRTVVSTKHLAYYMIPERNIMAASGLEGDQQRCWENVITAMMDEGPRIILRLHRIRLAVIAYPDQLLFYSKLRTELEMLQLEDLKRSFQLIDTSWRVDEHRFDPAAVMETNG